MAELPGWQARPMCRPLEIPQGLCRSWSGWPPGRSRRPGNFKKYFIVCGISNILQKKPLWLPSRPRGRLWSSPSCRRGLPYCRNLWNLTSKNEINLMSAGKRVIHNCYNKFYFFLVSERVAVVAEERVSPHHKNGQNWETKTPHNFPNHETKQMYITQANDGHDLRHQKRIKSFKIVCRTSISPF